MNSTRSLTGKVALVTGGSRGIGAEVARRLASDGAEIVIAYRSDKSAAENVVATLSAAGARAHASAVDIAVPEACEALVNDCIKACGRLDILVNAAGVAAYRPLDQADADHFHAMFNTNVLGALSLTRAFAAVVDGPGRLAETPMPDTSVYAASKAAVSAMTLALSQELGPRGITINAIAPGLIETDMTAAAVTARGDAIRTNTPLRRIGQPDDISGIVSFLASNDARWITGRTIRADGGLL